LFFKNLDTIIPRPLRSILFYSEILASSFNVESNTLINVGGGNSNLTYFTLKGKRRFLVNTDLFHPYLVSSRNNKYSDDCVLCDLRFLPIKNKAFDVSICLHVLEHLEKEKGACLPKELEMISCRQVILSTPVGFSELHEYDGNPYQKHKSSWTPKELRSMGFKVKGSCGLRYIRGERASPVLRSKLIGEAINFLATYLTQFFSLRILI